tara:strand:- start:4831 stop:5064 length:234 start_codon:yes stop_codon:yes gene_type:complete
MSHPRALLPEMEGKRANIVASGFAHQPKSWAELTAWLDRLSASERAMATTAAMMAWNLAARFDGHNEALAKAENPHE